MNHLEIIISVLITSVDDTAFLNY